MPVLFIYRDMLLMSLKLHRFWTFLNEFVFYLPPFPFPFLHDLGTSWILKVLRWEWKCLLATCIVGLVVNLFCGWNFPCTHFVSPISCWANFYEFTGQHLVAEFFLKNSTFEAFFCFASNPRKWIGYSWPCLQLGTDWKGGHNFFGKLSFFSL